MQSGCFDYDSSLTTARAIKRFADNFFVLFNFLVSNNKISIEADPDYDGHSSRTSMFFAYEFDSSLSCVNLVKQDNTSPDGGLRRTYSTSAPASTNCLLGNFEVAARILSHVSVASIKLIYIFPYVYFTINKCCRRKYRHCLQKYSYKSRRTISDPTDVQDACQFTINLAVHDCFLLFFFRSAY